MDQLKEQALKYCIEVYKQYTRAEIHNFHRSLIRCWKVGKRASKAKFEQDCKNAATQIARLEKKPVRKRFYRQEAGFISR